MSQRKVTVNYVTFRRDAEWMDYSLASFRKYATGFGGVTIVVPTPDIDFFLPYEKKYSTPTCPVLVKNFLEFPDKGFVHHLAMKCYADVFSPDSTHILHMDPDCLWSAPVTPDDYFVDGKPVLLIEPYEAFRTAHPGRYHWKSVTEVALKFECSHETMCRHPAIHHKWLYKAMREHIELVHLTPFYDFVIKQKNKFPQGFGEFNTLGSYALDRYKDKYHFIDRGNDGEKNDPPAKVRQLWSYTGVHSPDNQAAIRKLLA